MTARPRGTSTEELRDALTEHDGFLNYSPDQLVDIEHEARDKARAMLETRRGQPMLASEQRTFDGHSERADAARALHAQHVADYARRRSGTSRIEAERADARARNGITYGNGPAVTDDRFGNEIRNAIAEVRDGRSVAFVDIDETRTLLTTGAAGDAVPLDLRDPVTTLRARSIVMSLPGIRVEAMSSDRVRWPRFAQANVAATAEGATLPDAATDIDAVDVVAAKLATIEYISTELEEDLTSGALAAIGQNLVRSVAAKVDAELLTTIRNTPGINTTSLAGVPANFIKFRDAEYEMRLDNAEPAVWVLHPRTWKTLSGIKTGLASDESTLLEPDPQQGPKSLLGYPVSMSSQLTLVEGGGAGSWAGLFDTSQLVVCERRPARLEISREAAFSTDRVGIRCTWRGGIAVLNPEAVSVVTDVRA